MLAAGQLARYLGEHSSEPDADDAAEDPTEVTGDHVEAFQAWRIDTRSASTTVNKQKALRVFFGWLMNDEREIGGSPMERVRKLATPAKLIPVIEGDVPSQLLEANTGRDFLSLGDQATNPARAGHALDRILTTDDLGSGDNVFCGAGIADGPLLRGVRTDSDGHVTESLLTRSKSGPVPASAENTDNVRRGRQERGDRYDQFAVDRGI